MRERQFPGVRRGLDPVEVHRFLDQVADELAAARAELAWTRDENVRVKQALRDWQSRFDPWRQPQLNGTPFRPTGTPPRPTAVPSWPDHPRLAFGDDWLMPGVRL